MDGENLFVHDTYYCWNPIVFQTTIVQDYEMTKITNSNQSHMSYRKYKSENGRERTSKYIKGGIRCHGGVSIPC
jgi:hypothetical protein